MPDNNAAKSVHQYLLAEHIHIDFEEFKFQVNTHPDYPAVLAFSDALRFFGIHNMAARVDKNQMAELPQQFMALMVDFDEQEMLAFVQRKGSGFQFEKNGKLLQLTPAEFESNWKQVILLVEGEEQPQVIKPPVTNNQKALLLAGLLLLVVGLFWGKGLPIAAGLLLLTAVAGLYLSILAVKAELGNADAQQSLFCTALPKGDCNAVIGSAQGVLFKGIKITDVCIVFFTGQLLTLLYFIVAAWLPVLYGFMLITLVAALPLTFYSIYVQAAIAKKWCMICLAITALLYLQLATVAWLPYPGFEKGWMPQLLLYLAFFIITLAAWLLLKPFLRKYKELKQVHQKAIAFKRNYELFRYLLLQGQPVQLATADKQIMLGNPNASLRITLITNPFCGHCSQAHTIVEQLLHSYGNQLSIAIRFNYSSAGDDTQKTLHHQLAQLYQLKGPTVFMEALGQWFEHKDPIKWANRFATAPLQDEEAIVAFLLQQAQWNQAQQLNFTPAFLIGPYLYPTAYGRDELLHFIPELIDDETLTFLTV
jgi:uncharacterized membrane protein